ncbi:MAG: AraC family transcriptional regulator [Burkholderiaceae bacterium]|nr:AraC family transcriptional regulator [Burkholderiaceae bacterium]
MGFTARIHQYRSLAFARVPFTNPVLIVVQRGTKTLRSPGCEWVVPAGHAIAVNRGQTLDIQNEPAADGCYEARWLAWDESLFTEPPATTKSSHAIRVACPLGLLGPPLKQAIDAAISAVLEHPDPIPLEVAQHRMREPLVWMASRGAHFEPAASVSVRERVRLLLAGAPHRAWTAARIAGELSTSEATLRRRLTAEGASLSELLVDVRMSMALTLLQATRLPVAQIAMDMGYQSPSRFAVRFRKRFGFAPTTVRGHDRAIY